MSALQPALSTLTRQQIQSYFLRDSGSELFFQDTFVALKKSIVPRNLTLDRPCLGVQINWHGRIAVTVANINPVAAEAPQSIIEQITIKGNHSRFGSLSPWDIRGAHAFAYKQAFETHGGALYINSARQADPTSPFAQAGTTFGNIANYDLDIYYWLPTYPYNAPDAAKAGYLWTPEDWRDSLNITLQYGDASSLGTGGTVAFTAFGSGAGSPLVNISPVYCQLGPLSKSILPAVMVRNFLPKTAEVQASGSAIVVAELQKFRTRSVLIKTGTLLTGTSAGVNVYASLSDKILDPAQIFQDNKQIRIPNSTLESKEYSNERHGSVAPQGYNLIDFMGGGNGEGNPLTMFPGDTIPAGSHFQVKGTVVGAANQAAEIVQEYQVGAPAGIAG